MKFNKLLSLIGGVFWGAPVLCHYAGTAGSGPLSADGAGACELAARRQEAVGCRFPGLGGFGLHCAWFSEERAVDSALRLRAFCQ